MPTNPRPALLAALAKLDADQDPDQVLEDLANQYCIALAENPAQVPAAESRLSGHLRTHFPGVTIALSSDVAVVVWDTTPAGKVEPVRFRSAI